MTTVKSRWDLSDIEVSRSGAEAALNVVRRLTREKNEVAARWATAVRLARANGASLREIAAAAEVAPQTVANVIERQ